LTAVDESRVCQCQWYQYRHTPRYRTNLNNNNNIDNNYNIVNNDNNSNNNNNHLVLEHAVFLCPLRYGGLRIEEESSSWGVHRVANL